MDNTQVGEKIKDGPWKDFELISQYTSKDAVEDGFLFDIDPLIKQKNIVPHGAIDIFPIKYITTSVLELGYWNERCKNAIPLHLAGEADRCAHCPEFKNFDEDGKLSCSKKTLNIPNVLDLLTAAMRIFSKKPQDDYFISGRIELPSGKKQDVYIAINETGRYTLMLPSDN